MLPSMMSRARCSTLVKNCNYKKFVLSFQKNLNNYRKPLCYFDVSWMLLMRIVRRIASNKDRILGRFESYKYTYLGHRIFLIIIYRLSALRYKNRRYSPLWSALTCQLWQWYPNRWYRRNITSDSFRIGRIRAKCWLKSEDRFLEDASSRMLRGHNW